MAGTKIEPNFGCVVFTGPSTKYDDVWAFAAAYDYASLFCLASKASCSHKVEPDANLRVVPVFGPEGAACIFAGCGVIAIGVDNRDRRPRALQKHGRILFTSRTLHWPVLSVGC
jgi:hypothetical protein